MNQLTKKRKLWAARRIHDNLEVEIQYVSTKRTREDLKNNNKYSKNIKRKKSMFLRILKKSQNLQLRIFKSNHTNALIKANELKRR